MDKPPTWKQRTFGRLGTSTPNAIFIRKKANRRSVALEPTARPFNPTGRRPFPAYQSFMCTWPMCPSRTPPPSLFIHVFVWIMFVHKNILSSPCYLCLENRLYCCALCDETNKTRPHFHMFWRCLWNGSNLCGNFFSFCSNLCVFRLIVVTTFVLCQPICMSVW